MLTAPYSADDSYDVDMNYGASISAASGVLVNDVDYDGDTMVPSVYDYPQLGGVTLNSDGSFTYSPYGGTSGVDTFTYQSFDGSEYGNIATVTINLIDPNSGGGNNAPVASNDTYSADSNTLLSVAASGVLGNDTDSDGDSLTAQISSGPSNGTVTLYADGSFDYDAQGFSGTTTFSYTASDGSASSNVATVTLNVSPSGGGGSSLTAVSDTFYVEENSSSVELAVLLNDVDPNGSSLSVPAVTSPSNGSSSYGYGYSANDEVVFYTPNSAYTGLDSLSYDVSSYSETATGTVNLDVHGVDNTLAQARPLTLVSGAELQTGGVIGDGPQSWSDVDLFSVSLNAGDVLDIDVDALVTDSSGSLGNLDAYLRLFDASGFELSSNDSGIDPDSASSSDPFLSYTAGTAGTYYIGVSDSYSTSYDPNYSGGGSSYSYGAYELQLNLTASNAAPVASADSVSTHHGTVVQVDVLANDTLFPCFDLEWESEMG